MRSYYHTTWQRPLRSDHAGGAGERLTVVQGAVERFPHGGVVGVLCSEQHQRAGRHDRFPGAYLIAADFVDHSQRSPTNQNRKVPTQHGFAVVGLLNRTGSAPEPGHAAAWHGI